MRVRWLIAVCAFALLCGTPFASAMTDRSLRLLDGSPPVIDVPGNFSVESSNGVDAVVNYTVTVTDPDGDLDTWSCDPASGSTLAIGPHTIVCNASDLATPANTSSNSFTVTVTEPPPPPDTTAPTITTPGDFSVEASSSSGAIVTYSASATDPDDAVSSFGCSPASDTVFDLGPTTVTCTATDSHTNTASKSFTVSVVDTKGPVFGSVSSPPPTEATSTSGASVSYSNPTATDVVTGSRPVDCSPDSGSIFAITTSTVHCTASDGNGHSSSVDFSVTVRDTTPPTINSASVPSDIFADATSPGGAAVGFATPSATDLGAPASVGCSPTSGSTFAVGTTTVTCTANDGRGNTSQAQFHVSIAPFDATAPIITVPADITTEATNGSGTTVNYSFSATDPDDAVLSQSCSPSSGSTFGLGTTTVNCTATDHHSNTANKSFKVTVQDTTPPTVGTPPTDITREATGPTGVAVTFVKPSATDSVDGSGVPVTCVPGSGSTFAIGDTTVVCTATDDAGNDASKSFKVTVQDTLPPVFGAAPDVNASVAPGGSTVVTYTKPTATDAVTGVVAVNCTPLSGSAFPIGSTTVNCSASDSSGHSASTSFHVIVTDHTPPVITVPADITAEATGLSGAAVSYSFSAADPDDAVSTSSCTPAPGATFTIGQTTVTCNATDSHTNSASKTFKVTVGDTTPPVLTSVPTDKTVEANGFAGSIVDFVPPTAVDLGEPRLVSCAPGRNTIFALGTTTVTCSASDGRGNTGTATFKINVVDTTPPTLIPPGDFSAYAVENSGTFPSDDSVQKFVFGAHVSDIADPHPTLATDTPSFFPVGTTTVHFTATDASGNKATGSAKLTILPKPAPGTTPPPLPPPTDNIPPGNVTGLTGKGGDRRATLKWTNPKDSDFAAVEIQRGTNAAFSSGKATGTVVYHGSATSFVDKGLTNDVSYRYVVYSLDKNGNKSAGVPINVTPHLQLLKTPPDGARLAAIPKKFVWARDPKAAYYNFQLFLGGSLVLQSTDAEPRKILSTWTTGPALNFKNPWKWEGKSYKLAKGTYTWYVWPGYGARADVKYGPLMGSATFQITKTPKPAKKPAKPKKKKK
jgi:hypothetical protein